MSFETCYFLLAHRTFASIQVPGNAMAHTRATRVGNGTCFSKRKTFFRDHDNFCRPFGAYPLLDHSHGKPRGLHVGSRNLANRCDEWSSNQR